MHPVSQAGIGEEYVKVQRMFEGELAPLFLAADVAYQTAHAASKGGTQPRQQGLQGEVEEGGDEELDEVEETGDAVDEWSETLATFQRSHKPIMEAVVRILFDFLLKQPGLTKAKVTTVGEAHRTHLMLQSAFPPSAPAVCSSAVEEEEEYSALHATCSGRRCALGAFSNPTGLRPDPPATH
jgi:hypothetical protein